MAEYIDAKYLFKCTTCTNCRNGRCNTYCDHLECYTPNLNLIHTADVVEVRHGEWEEEHLVVSYYDDDVEVYFKCSVCGTGNFCESPYCPNCGAKMDGKENGDG